MACNSNKEIVERCLEVLEDLTEFVNKQDGKVLLDVEQFSGLVKDKSQALARILLLRSYINTLGTRALAGNDHANEL